MCQTTDQYTGTLNVNELLNGHDLLLFFAQSVNPNRRRARRQPGCVVVFIDVANVGASAVQTYDATPGGRNIRPSAKRGECTVAPRDRAYPVGLWFASSFPRFSDLIAGLG